MTTFSKFKALYDGSNFEALTSNAGGLYWLKLRSIGRKELLLSFADEMKIDVKGVDSRNLLERIFEKAPPVAALEQFIHHTFKKERASRKAAEKDLISQLYRMTEFSWGGFYQNAVEKTIVNNYVKKIRGWDDLNKAIDDGIYPSLRGYVRCSWYNHWTSIIIEDIFKDHRAVLPTVGLMKQVDFFVKDVPFDLKVTGFPDGYMQEIRKERDLKPEFTLLKKFARDHGVHFDSKAKPNVQFSELIAKIGDHPSADARKFMREFRATRRSIVDEAVKNPQDLIVWLYENQGERRFDASNRFFLILIDIDDMESSWKLKRNHALLSAEITQHLDSLAKRPRENLKIKFEWDGKEYSTLSDALFVVHGK